MSEDEIYESVIPAWAGPAITMAPCHAEPDRYPEQRNADRLWPIPVVAR